MQIDIDGSMLSLRYPMEVNLVGDSATTLQRAAAVAGAEEGLDMAARYREECREWWKTLEARAMDAAEPLNPQRVFWELSPRLPDNAIITAIPGRARTGMRAI